jgi:signal transduction histidine kinase
VVIPAADAARSATYVEREARPFAVVVHDATILDEPTLVEAVAAATRLSTAHAELQATVRDQLVELARSRRRLVSVADEERRRLDERLRQGPETTLGELGELLGRATDGGAEVARVGRARELLAQVVDDLHEVAAGLHPRELEHGLRPALEALVARSPLPVELAVEGEDIAAEAQTAVYYVCAEALANTVKHASATAAGIRVTMNAGGARVEVDDNGVGGANTLRGTGLRGLIDRVEALGGELRLESPPDGGTCLAAEIPNGLSERTVTRPAASPSSDPPARRTRHDAHGDADPYGRSHLVTEGSSR